jgi:hypothetical protein
MSDGGGESLFISVQFLSLFFLDRLCSYLQFEIYGRGVAVEGQLHAR